MRFLAVIIASLSVITVQAAATDSKEVPPRGACREEAKKICGDMKPGDGKVRQCIEANRDKFSPACQERMGNARERAGAVHKACQADAQKLCAGVEPGGGRLHQCLRKNEASLSTECRDAMQDKSRQSRPAKGAT